VPVPEDRRPAFRLLVVPGVTVDKWARVWSERLPGVDLRVIPAEAAQAATLLPVSADAGLLRLPASEHTFHAIPLYTEVTVVVIPRDHALAGAADLTVADLAGETLLRPLDDVLDWTAAPGTEAAHRPATTALAVELVAAGTGLLVVPQSLARLYHRRDLTYRAVTDAPASSVGLVWMRDRHTELVEDMIGIVRGRTANSTRGRTPEQPARTPAKRAAPTANRPNPRRGGASPRRRGR
jgi:DNA-binding transcriptional LysR family regulator